MEERTLILVQRGDLIRGRKLSCGCIQKEEKLRKQEIKELKKQERIERYNKLHKTQYDLISEEYGIGVTANGYRFIFDKEDYDKIKPYSWQKGTKGELITRRYQDGKRISLLLHRLVMNVCDTNIQVDHIKHKRYDNRKSQLRIVDNSKKSNEFKNSE